MSGMSGMSGMMGTILRRAAPRVCLRVRLRARVRTAAVLLGLSGVSVGVGGCGALDVSDPTAIEERELQDASGALLLRGAALKVLSQAVTATAVEGGLLADEFFYNLPPGAQPGLGTDLLDRRESVAWEQLFDGGAAVRVYGLWQELRHAASVALPKLRAYTTAPRVGEMFALRGVGTLRLAEDFCPGFPLPDLVDYELVTSPPVSTEAALAKALADFDSAVAAAADSVRIRHLAQVGRARTLLELGRFAEAAAAVEGVPTAYVAQVEYLESGGATNGLFFGRFGNLSRSVADQEGGTGLDFVTAEDPRVRVDTLRPPSEGVIGIYRSAKYPTPDAPIVLASGIEARLIEAEAALHEGGDWLGILNALRTEAVGGVAGLAPLSDPGTEVARQDLLFRERAFWLYATGHRLADLRRLVRLYGRPADSVFPTGAYHQEGAYGTATSLPFPAVLERSVNPAVTGCTSR